MSSITNEWVKVSPVTGPTAPVRLPLPCTNLFDPSVAPLSPAVISVYIQNVNNYSKYKFGGLNSDCYRRLKSGYRLDSRIVRESINVRGQYECENECLRSRTFLCRSFSFRFVVFS